MLLLVVASAKRRQGAKVCQSELRYVDPLDEGDAPAAKAASKKAKPSASAGMCYVPVRAFPALRRGCGSGMFEGSTSLGDGSSARLPPTPPSPSIPPWEKGMSLGGTARNGTILLPARNLLRHHSPAPPPAHSISVPLSSSGIRVLGFDQGSRLTWA